MPHGDFDVDALAAYLHVTPARITRLADRDRLPGRKVGGQWRFAKAEIHLWMENRLGLLDDDEMTEVEEVLERSAEKAGDAPVVLAEMISPALIDVSLQARSRNKVIDAIAELGATAGLLWDPKKMSEAIRAREDMQPTALENGVALLHPRRPMPGILADPFVALCRSMQRIPFGGSHGQLTDIFFLVCSLDDRTHLRTLAKVARLVSDVEFLEFFRGGAGPDAVYSFIVDHEEQHQQ